MSHLIINDAKNLIITVNESSYNILEKRPISKKYQTKIDTKMYNANFKKHVLNSF